MPLILSGATGTDLPENEIDVSLFDMNNDPLETENVIEKYPDIAEKLMEFAGQHKNRFYPE